MFKIIQNTKYWYIISGTLLVLSIIAIAVFGLRVGIDYTGGSIITYETTDPGALEAIENILEENEIISSQIKESGEDQITVRTENLDVEKHNSINAAISESVPGIKEVKYDNVGPTIGRDLTNKSILAVIVASIAIIAFVAYSFRKVPKPLSSWKFGVLAVVTLLHDLIITTGFVALMGAILPWMEVDVLFITALLTIMGFSVHDTIVIYDRLRENFIKHPGKMIEHSAEESVNQTLIRSINTSLTTIFVLLALFLLGGESIRHFVLVLIFGIAIGTYSSIFVAAPTLVSWHKKNN